MQKAESKHKAGFVSIIGKPNVGKSTLMNYLIGEKLSIITSKAQTTRHRILGIVSEDDYQIVFSDTPGIIKPQYDLHESMMDFVNKSISDADAMIFMTDLYEKFDEKDVLEKLAKTSTPVIVLINKIDLAKEESAVIEKIQYWQEKLSPQAIVPVSALEKFNVDKIIELILEHLPVHPPYYSKDELTDKPERFFAAETIRKFILETYEKEIPYSCEVIVDSFKEEPNIIRINANILVERDSQKGILIGHQGQKLKKVGTNARKEMETFFGKKIFLQTHVKVEANWRKNKDKLKKLGYINK